MLVVGRLQQFLLGYRSIHNYSGSFGGLAGPGL